jgi:predicted nuclease of restriction endonuclease-like (RecB) superfamily
VKKKPLPKRAPRSPTTSISPRKTITLLHRIVTILEEARARVIRSVNTEMVLAYWQIGREIVESVQGGEGRAEYGEAVLETLSGALTKRFGRGFSVTNLRYFRLFYVAFSDRGPEIRQLSVDGSRRRGVGGAIHQFTVDGSGTALVRPTRPPARRGFSPALSWGHYRTLAKVDDPAARLFYEIEAERAGWSRTDLERQVHTQLFARLRKSRDKAGVMDLASRGIALQRPMDVIRDPYVLDFLDLPDAERLHENDLEAAIIDKLQHFLLELGKGFAFYARQMRLEYDDECLYVDLVFYNCVLKCFLLIDLKMGRLTHEDVGQMDSYVRLFDDRYTTPGDNPTIGLILCAEKNEAVARYSVLHNSEQLFAARYVTYLPTVEELERELLRERRRIEARRPRERKGR